MECPRCGSSDTSKCGKSESGYQRYFCTGCQKSFKGEEYNPTVTTRTTATCPRCGSVNTVKTGIQNGVQKRWCNGCEHHFLDEYQRSQRNF